jgi:hypothetical protein
VGRRNRCTKQQSKEEGNDAEHGVGRELYLIRGKIEDWQRLYERESRAYGDVWCYNCFRKKGEERGGKTVGA